MMGSKARLHWACVVFGFMPAACGGISEDRKGSGEDAGGASSGSAGTSSGASGVSGTSGSASGGVGGSAGRGGTSGSSSGGTVGNGGGDTGGFGGVPICEDAPLAAFCVRGTPVGENEALEPGDHLRIELRPGGCYSSSCTEAIVQTCSVSGSGNHFVVT